MCRLSTQASETAWLQQLLLNHLRQSGDDWLEAIGRFTMHKINTNIRIKTQKKQETQETQKLTPMKIQIQESPVSG